MKIKWMTFLLCATASVVCAQDWSPCKQVDDKIKAVVEAFNKEHAAKHDGLSYMAGCQWSNPEKPKPRIYYPLSKQEAAHKRYLGSLANAAFKAESGYEHYLIKKRGFPYRDYRACSFFVGFVLDDDYISVDPNAWMDPDKKCHIELPPGAFKPDHGSAVR